MKQISDQERSIRGLVFVTALRCGYLKNQNFKPSKFWRFMDKIYCATITDYKKYKAALLRDQPTYL